MKYYLDETEIPALNFALACCTGDDLKKFAVLTGESRPAERRVSLL